MPRTRFKYKGEWWNYMRTDADGWRYYRNAANTKTIRCKGMRVEEVTE